MNGYTKSTLFGLLSVIFVPHLRKSLFVNNPPPFPTVFLVILDEKSYKSLLNGSGMFKIIQFRFRQFLLYIFLITNRN